MASVVRTSLIFGSYPLTIAAGFLVFWLLSSLVSADVAAYAAVLLGALIVTFHEISLPYRQAWDPDWTDFRNDCAYMLVGQVVLERVLTIVALFAVVSIASRAGWQLKGFWPYGSPVWVQAILVLVLGDFLRYWLHRGFHRIGWMWRFHSVHHSPKRLYWLNVGRFHPIEQTMQFVVDALPFIALGLGVDVLSAYFVFYAINGFFQHSNCHVRLGWLNWIVAGPELHRWHHSLNLDEANHNYGNNLILWDTIFGTRYLPRQEQVQTLGIPVPNYPTSFLKQMAAPFDRRLASSE